MVLIAFNVQKALSGLQEDVMQKCFSVGLFIFEKKILLSKLLALIISVILGNCVIGAC